MKRYYGVLIDKCSLNSSGMKYNARTGDGIVLKSDTIAGIKLLIKQNKTKNKLK